ncbi:flagellar assembly peptidoglycan hydrolase FlgJ [Neopusillimonas aromaticivorans]|uniref:flagellar assembly peptidoglycan hydrolase FlgJ n=1 Tax=Neopusillimonas aromaticivorans TaxID=2979868 RepID=UPI00259AB6A4|nr:flagellar assembly peptidoglycan hydrolase FlgJ [Neopusillimonas aromaticivorans]WJJ93187.1 flagellar assembly peptidoglycan hydrolase FlgJ [Neopusillimonas aromaticivorans]
MNTPYFLPRPTELTPSSMDFSHLDRLKRSVQGDGAQNEEALRDVAQQFETLMLQQLLKQARQSTPGLENIMGSQQMKLAQSMSDEQIAQSLGKAGGLGLAQALLDQLRGNLVASVDARLSADRGLPGLSGASVQGTGGTSKPFDSISDLLELLGKTQVGQRVRSSSDAVFTAIKGAPSHIEDFVAQMAEPARQAAEKSGIPAKLILSQAALESGWGKREIRGEDGSNSYNLFGIKATSSWKGKVVNIMTTEYVDGEPQKMMQPFRAYNSYAESFADYARLISQTERYSEVMTAPDAKAAAVRIQEAGYATDPAYADKLISIMGYFDDRLGNTAGNAPRNLATMARR